MFDKNITDCYCNCMGFSTPNEGSVPTDMVINSEGPSHVFYDIPPRYLPLLYTLPSERTLLPENETVTPHHDPSLVHISILNTGRWVFPNKYDHTRTETPDWNSKKYQYESVTIPGQQPTPFEGMYQQREPLLDAFLTEAVGPKQDDIYVYRAPIKTEWDKIVKQGFVEVLERTNFENEALFQGESSQAKMYCDQPGYAQVILRAQVDPRLYVGVFGTQSRVENRYPHFLLPNQLEYSTDKGQTWTPLPPQPTE